MSALLNFAFEEHLVRVVDQDGEPWFVAADVAKALAFRNASDAVRSVPDEEKGTHKVRTLGGEQSLITINEPGLYRLVFRSNKPEAERFQHFVFHEVLPQIRKTGRYEPAANDTPQPNIDNDVLNAIQIKLQVVREARLIFGLSRARDMWAHLGLPEPAKPVTAGSDREAADIISVILAALANRQEKESVASCLAAALDGDGEAQKRLMACGLRAAVDEPEDGLYIAARHEWLNTLLKPRCGPFGWQYVLRRLPGVFQTQTMRFGSTVSKAVFVPARHLAGVSP